MPKKYKYRKVFIINGQSVDIKADSLEELYEKKVAKTQELTGAPPVDSSMTLNAWAAKCLPLYKVDITLGSYKTIERRVAKEILWHIGARRISTITPEHCQLVLNNQRGRSKSYIDKVYNDMRFLFKRAVAAEIIVKDPTANLVKPRGTYTPRRALTAEERNCVIQTIKTDRRYYLYGLMLFCGCRPSEASECIGADISVVDGVAVLHIRGTKTRLADRYVPIPADFYDLIKDTPKREYIAQNTNGKPYTETTRPNLWKSFFRACNRIAGCKTYRNQLIPPYPFPEDLSSYCLRHEYCTDLARRGIDIRIAQKLMGHSTITLTADIYTHVADNDLTAAARTLGAFALSLPKL